MFILRPLFLLICDLILEVFTRFRKLASLAPGDLQFSISGPLIVKDFYPYDLVMVASEISILETLSEIPVIGEDYKIGTVIGYKGLNQDGEPQLIKVAYFNSGETNVPTVKLFKPKELVLVYPTLQNARISADLSEALYENINNLKNNNLGVTGLFGELEDDLTDEDDGGSNNGGTGGNTIH
jgi:hypothetical protein